MPLAVPNNFGGVTSGTTQQLDDDFTAVEIYVNARNPTVGLLAGRPAAGNAGALYIASDQGNTVYVDNGSTWLTIVRGMGAVLLAVSQPVSSGANTTETDTVSYTLPGGTLSTNGDILEIVFHFRTGANANTKRFRAYLGATLILDTGALAMNQQCGDATLRVQRTGVTAQFISQLASWSTTGVNGAAPLQLAGTGNAAENLAANLAVRVTMTNGTATAADCIVDFVQVRLWPNH